MSKILFISLFSLFTFNFSFSQDSLYVRGVLLPIDASICMDQCSWYTLDPDEGYEAVNITQLPDPAALSEYVGQHVEILGHMEQCFMCEALNADWINVLDENTVTYEGTLYYNDGGSFCMDGCDEFTLELIDDYPEPEIIASTLEAGELYSSESFELSVFEEELTFRWANGYLNCCVEPQWSGWLGPKPGGTGNDTFYLEFNNNGPDCDCMDMPFNQTVTMGPFTAGEYNFQVYRADYNQEIYFGSFTIEDNRDWVWVTTLGSPESIMEFNGEHVIVSGEEIWCVECGGVLVESIELAEPDEEELEVYFGFGLVDPVAKTAEIIMNVNEQSTNWDGVAGIQFNISGGTIDATFGGYIQDYFSIVANGDSAIVIFGDYVINGMEGVLLNIQFTEFYSDEICLNNVILSQATGEQVENVEIGECAIIGTYCELPGDMNDDGVLNVLDIISMVNCALIPNPCDPCSDVNEDGELNILDIVMVVNIILSGGTLPDDCYIEPEVGPCDGICPTYYYNQNSGECEEFITGCCGVEAFDSMGECQEVCE